MFNKWIKQSKEKFCLMEVSGSNEVKHLKIAQTKSFKLYCRDGWKKKTNTDLSHAYLCIYEIGLLLFGVKVWNLSILKFLLIIEIS